MSKPSKEPNTPIFESIGNYLRGLLNFGPAAEPEESGAETTSKTASKKAPEYAPTSETGSTTSKQAPKHAPTSETSSQSPATASLGISDEITQENKDHLAIREGFRQDVYLDSEGKATAGTGHLLSASELAQYPLGSIVPQNVLDQWLKEDSEDAYAAAYMQAVEIGFENQTLVDALVAVNFQLGTAWNEEHQKTWGYLVDHNWEAAALEAGDSKWYQ